MNFGRPEIIIILVAVDLMLFGILFGRRVQVTLGIRNLTFDRKSDIAIAFGIVAAFAASILLL